MQGRVLSSSTLTAPFCPAHMTRETLNVVRLGVPGAVAGSPAPLDAPAAGVGAALEVGQLAMQQLASFSACAGAFSHGLLSFRARMRFCFVSSHFEWLVCIPGNCIHKGKQMKRLFLMPVACCQPQCCLHANVHLRDIVHQSLRPFISVYYRLLHVCNWLVMVLYWLCSAFACDKCMLR